MRDPKAIMITGASSGIGAALAVAYAGPGRVLALTGRNRVRLDDTSERCRMAGALVETFIVDVRDYNGLAAWIAEIDAKYPLDLVIANVGISAGTDTSTGTDAETDEAIRLIFAVNVGGVINTVLPVVPLMRRRRRGQIAIISSLAGFRGFPGAAAYCASKAAERIFGESLRVELAADGVSVSVICPGFIRTPMTDTNSFAMPFLMEPCRAATIIKFGLTRNRARIAFPWRTYAVCWLLAALPPSWSDRLLRLAPKKS
ncbi:MAG: SDR family NAD(P)-dependent oxidoreductase [Rhodospirillaceae bacterium]